MTDKTCLMIRKHCQSFYSGRCMIRDGVAYLSIILSLLSFNWLLIAYQLVVDCLSSGCSSDKRLVWSAPWLPRGLSRRLPEWVPMGVKLNYTKKESKRSKVFSAQYQLLLYTHPNNKLRD